jgi:hypothetical protein
MDYKEALAISLKVRWKTAPCKSGEECWCRLITPEEDIEDDEGNEVYIASSGTINKEHAEHIVRLHNESLKTDTVWLPRLI